MPKTWTQRIFDSKIAKRGGLARRKISNIEKYSSRENLKSECKKRGFHIVENGDQWVIICNEGHVKIIL